MCDDRNSETARPCDPFLEQKRLLLGDHGFTADSACPDYTINGNVVLYHYTREEHLNNILASTGGLWARLCVVHCDVAPEFVDCYLVEALLQPEPRWFRDCPYFGDFGLEMMHAYVGNTLLRIELPADFPGIYVSEAAHSFECKHIRRRGRPALNLGYRCENGHEVCCATINSYIPLAHYTGGHVAPNVKITRQGEGIVIPGDCIRVCETQPLLEHAV